MLIGIIAGICFTLGLATGASLTRASRTIKEAQDFVAHTDDSLRIVRKDW